MKSASVPRPLAEIIFRSMADSDGPHYEGWTQRVAPGWYIVRQSAHYKLLHGRISLGTIVCISLSSPPFQPKLEIFLASGIVLSFPIREPRGVTE